MLNMTTIIDQITTLIQDSIKEDLMQYLPKVADRKLSFHELEAIFLGHGNGHKMFIVENDEEAWENLTQKEKNIWNSKAKKQQRLEVEFCNAKKKDGSVCTTKAKTNGFCGKHKDSMKNAQIAKDLAAGKNVDNNQEDLSNPTTSWVRKKINGKFYNVDEDNMVFDILTNKLIGAFDPETKTIKEEHNDTFFDNSSMDEDSENEEPVHVDEIPKIIKMKRKKIDGKFYYIDANQIFDLKTKKLVGYYNPDTKKIMNEEEDYNNSEQEGSVIVDSDQE